MVLFHNTEIKNLNSIAENGLLSADECGAESWESGKRAENSTAVVYLFQPTGELNSLTNYGAALIAVDVAPEEVAESELAENDFGRGKYVEYTAQKVAADKIKAIYIPRVFKHRISGLSEKVLAKVVWCELSAKMFDHCEETGKYSFGIPETRCIYREATEDELRCFGERAEIESRFNTIFAPFTAIQAQKCRLRILFTIQQSPKSFDIQHLCVKVAQYLKKNERSR